MAPTPSSIALDQALLGGGSSSSSSSSSSRSSRTSRTRRTGGQMTRAAATRPPGHPPLPHCRFLLVRRSRTSASETWALRRRLRYLGLCDPMPSVPGEPARPAAAQGTGTCTCGGWALGRRL
ncbi:hypothetical protein CDD83_10059 [Cordyceps sp. RAO-2017]|nr:hypothetical protein CDD83_10059 [Cordyceps sp. RAO-2017]